MSSTILALYYFLEQIHPVVFMLLVGDDLFGGFQFKSDFSEMTYLNKYFIVALDFSGYTQKIVS